jgi:hypothetical protein
MRRRDCMLGMMAGAAAFVDGGGLRDFAGAVVRGEASALALPSPFDGESLAGWTTTQGEPVGPGWEVADGVIHLTKRGPPGQNIITAEEFGDFDLSFEWKISPGGNNGIKYRVRKYDGQWLGCEYQMFDDEGRAPELPRRKSGAIYDLYEPGPEKVLHPPGEYNSGRIVVRGDQIEHWLNGRKIVSATVGDGDWDRRIAASKFVELPDFARHRRGRLMITDYDGPACFRNFKFVAS